MRKYWVNWWKNFGNTYWLCWTDQKEPPVGNWTRISRIEAEWLARRERNRRKTDPSFAYNADACIAPYGYGCIDGQYGNIIKERHECEQELWCT